MDNKDENIKTGTAKWYKKRTSKNGTVVPGHFNLRSNIECEIPYDNKEDVRILINKKKGIICIRRL
jgi:hypothetical protein